MFLLFFLTVSCTHIKNNNVEAATREFVTIYNYRLWFLDTRDLWDSTVTYINTVNLCNRNTCVYALNDSTSLYWNYAVENDSLFIDNMYYANLDTIYLNYKDEIIEVIKSRWLNHKCFFWNYDYGLVAAYDDTNIVLYDKETMKGFAKDTFYNYFANREKERERLIFEGLEPDEYR
jgi:hypothetical protein